MPSHPLPLLRKVYEIIFFPVYYKSCIWKPNEIIFFPFYSENWFWKPNEIKFFPLYSENLLWKQKGFFYTDIFFKISVWFDKQSPDAIQEPKKAYLLLYALYIFVLIKSYRYRET